MHKYGVLRAIKLIEKQVRHFQIPSVTLVAEKNDPYKILISCILSLRTKDKTTIQASRRLFETADTPKKMLRVSEGRLQKIIYPVGFYRNKTKNILDISRVLLKEYGGKVPADIDKLLTLRGVGRKTANLVLGLGFNIPSICVDTHVHRISNRIGWVKSPSPFDTEVALQQILPKSAWISLNTILVAFGQNICLPVSPYCTKCILSSGCPRVGVGKSR